MRNSLLKAGFTAAVLLFHCQFAATQVLVTEFGANWMLNPPVSTQEPARSNGAQNYFGQMLALAEDVAGNGISATQAVEGTEFTVYPGRQTTVNGMPVYVSTLIKTGDRVQTGGATGKLVLRNVILDLGVETTVVMQEPIVLHCGVIVVRSGTIVINNGTSTLSFAAGQTAYSTSPSCESALPDSPSTLQTAENTESTPRPKSTRGTPSAAARGGPVFDAQEAGWSFWAANAAMFGSSIAAAEMTHRCLQAGACSFVPDTFHRRRNMYLVGMPVAAGVSYFSHYLKRKGHRWWFVPTALVTVGNAVVITHAARYR